MFCFIRINEEAQWSARGGRGATSIDKYKLDFHSFGQNALDVNGNALSYLGTQNSGFLFANLGKACKIGGKFHEHTVTFNTAYNARNGLPRA